MTDGVPSITTSLSYDAVPYPSYSYSGTHPDHLATLARLFGMQPASVEQCRVLELGCASGGNVIPMAYGLPQSEFVGIDLAEGQIAQGQAMAAELGVRNLSLRHLDILDVNGDLGEFDYIIAHGVFSWVPRLVQDKVLEICQQALAPNGVAYVSYNVYPGWHMIDMVRGMMLYHTRGITDPETRATQARALLSFLAESVPDENSAYGSFLKMYAGFLSGESEGARPKDDALLLHDELEAVNQPLYFHQFVEWAARFGLQYLAEARFCEMFTNDLQPEVSETLSTMVSSLVELEQYIDFLRHRTFRRTLLCHQDVTLNRRLEPGFLKTLFAASQAQSSVPDPDIHSVSIERFRGSDGAVLSTDHPVTKAAMLCLAEAWPRALSFDELLSAARARLNGDAEGKALGQTEDEEIDPSVLAFNLLKAFGYSETLAELHVYAPSIEVEIRERPVANPVSRLQALAGDRVTNLYHHRVQLDGLQRFLLPRLDGTHDHGMLLDLLVTGPVAQGRLTAEVDGKLVEDPGEIKRLLADELETNLRGLASAALLIS